MIPVVILFHRNEHLLSFYYKPVINLSPVTFPCCRLWNQAQRGLVICPRSHSFGANPNLASKPYSSHYTSVLLFINMCQGLPWWCSGWESACQCRGHRFEPWSGKIPHATEQLGPWATITEPAHLEPVLRNKRGRDSETPAHRDEEWPPLAATRESPRTETKTQHSHK